MQRFKSCLMSTCVLFAAMAITPLYAADTTQAVGATQGATMHSQTIAAADAGPSPYQIKLQYTGEAWDNAEGGIHTGTAYMNNVDAQLRVNTDQAFGWTGGKFYVEGFYNSSRSLDTQYVGAAQDPSVIDTSGQTMFRLYEAFYDQNLGNTDLLLGVYDPQTEFGNTKPMDIFMNGAYAWNTVLDQSGGQGLNGPSNYPNTALGFRARQKIDNQWSIQGVILDGMADSVKHPGENAFEFKSKFGALAIGEVDYTPAPRTKIMAGYFGYTGKFDKQNQINAGATPKQVYGSDGGYIGGATRLFSVDAHRGLDGFANIGFADPTVNEIDRTLNFGLNFVGPFEARPTDKVGIAFSIAGAGNPYRKQQVADGESVYNYETNLELTYRATITSWLTVQPDIQYWTHPNYDPNLKDDLLIGVHFEIGHLFDL